MELERDKLVLQSDPMWPSFWPVHSLRQELPDTWTVEFLPDSVFRFEPGQFNMLYVYGVGEVPISISGDPTQTGRIVHTIRDVGKVSGALCRLEVDQAAGVRGPYGTGWPLRQAEGADLLFIAGGVGLAPLRPAIYHALKQRRRYGRVTILYGARDPRSLLFEEELHEWSARFDVEVMVTVDRGDRSWFADVGVVTRLIKRIDVDPFDTCVMLCGPEIMMRFSVREVLELGIPAQQIYVSLERNMKCAVGFCGHCQFGGALICRDGPVFRFDRVAERMSLSEI